MTFKISSLRYGYSNVFADRHIELIHMPVIPEGFSRAVVGDKLKRPIAYAKGDVTGLISDNFPFPYFTQTLIAGPYWRLISGNFPFPSEYGIYAYSVMQYQPNLDLTFYAWIKG